MSLQPVILDLRAGGCTSLPQIMDALNEQGIRTRQDRRWHVSNVRNLLRRLDRAKAPLF
ncbi:recombinase family protein [Psychromarinibacter halotolerans]|uniref:Recombinase family protein n=1 Tax=Psychromarinibacter halotolerans TaxID=1775175 RepID=A0ABV7GS90_9RHOB